MWQPADLALVNDFPNLKLLPCVPRVPVRSPLIPENSVLSGTAKTKWKIFRAAICSFELFVMVDGDVQNNKGKDVKRESLAELRRLGLLRSDLERRREVNTNDFTLETLTLPLEAARLKVRDILDREPTCGHPEAVEGWRQLADGKIEFTTRRWPAPD
jgi:hypothetical protein